MGDNVKKFDIIIVLSALIAAGALYFSGILRADQQGAYAVVYSDGKFYKKFDLNQDTEYEIDVNGHKNTLVIKDGKADITEADCPDKLCVKQKSISLKNETIVCLPNKIVVEIEGAEESPYDAVAN